MAAVATAATERTVCPADLDQDIGEAPVPADGAAIEGNILGLAYVAALGARGALLEDIIRDARALCVPMSPDH